MSGGVHKERAFHVVEGLALFSAGVADGKAAPAEIEIIREGQIADGPKPIPITSEHIREMVANFSALVDEPPVDREHESALAFNEAGARGWVKSLRAAPSSKTPKKLSLYGAIDWTAEGTDDVVGKRYRYVSGGVVWQRKDPETGKSLGAALDHVALVKNARVKGMAPLTLSAGAAGEENPMNEELRSKLVLLFGAAKDADEVVLLSHVQKYEKEIVAIASGKGAPLLFLGAEPLARLGLDGAATFVEVKGKINELAGKAGELVTLGARVVELETKQLEAEVDQVIAEFKAAPAERAELLELARSNVKLFRALISKREPMSPGRAGLRTPKDKARGDVATEKAKAQKKAIADFMASNKDATYTVALMECSKADPVLFARDAAEFRTEEV